MPAKCGIATEIFLPYQLFLGRLLQLMPAKCGIATLANEFSVKFILHFECCSQCLLNAGLRQERS